MTTAMDVPFVSSGAMSRAHYTLVRKVESADSIQLADKHLRAEIKLVQQRLAHPTLSLMQCKECLVVLLYCSMSITSAFLATGTLDFALSHGVNLAEAGHTVQDKRIGYLFCAEVMPPNHELQLMLVNTLRKDLESSEIPRICLALDMLITSSSEDVIPAVQSRLHDLLSHNSLHIRRRALLAFRALSFHDPQLLLRISGLILERLKDPHPAIVSAGLIVSAHLMNIHPPARNDVHVAVNDMLQSTWSSKPDKSQQLLILKLLHADHISGPSSKSLHVVLSIVRSASRSHAQALLHGAFLWLSYLTSEPASLTQLSSRLSPVHNIRRLLTSRDPNDQYLFLSCLGCLDPVSWAGTRPDMPALLEEWEVERIMQLLDSSDNLIRRKTLRILNNIDMGIVATYYSQSLRTIPSTLSVKGKNEYTTRLLEVLEVQPGGDGEFYATRIKELFAVLEGETLGESQYVLESAVQMVLLYVRNAGTTFRIGCVTNLVTSVAEPDTRFGPTLLVITSALASEYCGKLAIPPVAIVRGLARKLTSCHRVQDACLLSMLRIVAECDQVPSDVVTTVTELGRLAGRHIQRRCDQFVTLSAQKEVLGGIVRNARSSSLPDFLEALQSHISRPSQRSTPTTTSVPLSPRSDPSSSRASLLASKLRYTAYEPPSPAPRLRRPSGSQRSVSSSRSATFSDQGGGGYELNRISSRSSGAGANEEGVLSRTVTAGDLALVAGAQEFEIMTRPSSKPEEKPGKVATVEDLSSRMDLIAFDSPFISEPSKTDSEHESAASPEPDFESAWNALSNSSGTRGWCETSVGGVVRSLHEGLEGYLLRVTAVDRPPFEGELKILISPGVQQAEGGFPSLIHAALRLRESEEESCLWQLRCADARLRTRVKQLLTDD